MKVWLVTSKEQFDYDQYDAAVVVAETAGDAWKLALHKAGWPKGLTWDTSTAWPSQDRAKFDITEITPEDGARVVLASMNAG